MEINIRHQSPQKVIVVKTSLLRSIIEDTYTFCGLFIFYWLNYKFFGGSEVVYLTISVAIIIMVLSIGSKDDYTIDGAYHLIKKMKDENDAKKRNTNNN